MAYATFADLTQSYGAGLLARICLRADDEVVPLPEETIELRASMALDDASGFMDGFFGGTYATPIITTSQSAVYALRNCCCVIAVSDLIQRLGYIQGSEDHSLVLAADRWRKWLEQVAKGVVTIAGASVSATADVGSTGPRKSFYVAGSPSLFGITSSSGRDRFA